MATKKNQNATRDLTEDENAAIAAATNDGSNESAPTQEADAAIAAAILAKSKENPDLLTDEERLLLEDLSRENESDDREPWEKEGFVPEKSTPEQHAKKANDMVREVVKTLDAMNKALENLEKEAQMSGLDPAIVINIAKQHVWGSKNRIINFDPELQ